jgi:hypothetical protein
MHDRFDRSGLPGCLAPAMQATAVDLEHVDNGPEEDFTELDEAALVVFAGAVTGRLLPAMSTTVVGFIGVRLLVMPDAASGFGQLRNDHHGDRIVASHVSGTTEVLTIHPAHQFWAFQAIETNLRGPCHRPAHRVDLLGAAPDRVTARRIRPAQIHRY